MTQQKLKNKILILSLLFISQGVLTQSFEKIYIDMPDVLNPTLSKQNRLELIEYFKVGQSDSVSNRFGNQARILILDSVNRILKVKNTPVSMFEMKLFRLNDNTSIVGIISTVCASICQSSVQFYDTAWNLVPLKFQLPKAVEWLKNDSLIHTSIDKEWLKNELKTGFISLEFDIEENKIIAKNNSLQFISEKDCEQIKPFVNSQPFVYSLKDKIWVKE